MSRKNIKRLMSAFLAFVMILGLSIGGTDVLAAENAETLNPNATTNVTIIDENNWSFTQQRDSDTRTAAGRFYSTAGQSVSFTMIGVNSPSSQGFDVKLCRIVNNVPQVVGGTIHVDGNLSITKTITFGIYTSGTYIIRCSRTKDGNSQNISRVKITLN